MNAKRQGLRQKRAAEEAVADKNDK